MIKGDSWDPAFGPPPERPLGSLQRKVLAALADKSVTEFSELRRASFLKRDSCREASSLGKCLLRLRDLCLVERVGRGQYRITAAGSRRLEG